MQSRLEQLMHRRVIYTVTDQDGIYTGTVERDSNGRAYVQDDNGICMRALRYGHFGNGRRGRYDRS